MDPTLPTAIEIDDSPDRIRQDLLDQLYWNIFGPLRDISVRDSTKLTPFSHHTIRSESLAEPPVSRLAVRIHACQEKYSMDEADDEEYRYQPPAPLVIEKLDGTPILLSDFVTQVHPFLNANKEEIFKCEDEMYTQPTELEDGWKVVGVDPGEFEAYGEDQDESAKPSHFLRSGNIPAGSRFFFDQAQFNEADTDEFEAYVVLFVEGNMGTSVEQFWEQRSRGCCNVGTRQPPFGRSGIAQRPSWEVIARVSSPVGTVSRNQAVLVWFDGSGNGNRIRAIVPQDLSDPTKQAYWEIMYEQSDPQDPFTRRKSGSVYSCDEFPAAGWIEGGVGIAGPQTSPD